MQLYQLALVLSLIVVATAQSSYIIGNQGESCAQACYAEGLNCNPHIVTNDSIAIFQSLGIDCNPDNRSWWAEDQPSFAADSHDANFGKCLGYITVPGGVFCGGSYPSTRRLCRCDAPSKDVKTFGTGLSSGAIYSTEQWVFQHFVAEGDAGVMTHFWITYPGNVDRGVIIRYYIDGEETASIEFEPSLACGVGSYDAQGPWGTRWFGKGAADGAWFWNFRVPFQKSIVVTTQHLYGTYGGFYMIVRGGTNLPISIGDLVVPYNAKLNLFKTVGTFDPVEFVPVATVPSGSGVHFMHTLSVESGNLNFLEGCYHMYSPINQDFPGTVLSTGTEDYFDSAWYFNAGEFHLPVSGFTHLNTTAGVTWSAYRFHEQDPLQFSNGFKLVWRNGDINDPAGMKCMMETGDGIVGNPTASNVTSYAWVYTWN